MDEGGKSLYEVLGVEKGASQSDIKKAYYRLALQLHPDKNPGDEESKRKFQALQRIYAVLGDADKRALYDETGSLQDCEEIAQGGFGSGEGGAFAHLYRAYSALFKRVDEDDIIAFARQYRGSDEERGDLLCHYAEHRGDMARVFESVMLSRPEVDSHRFMVVIDEAINKGEVERTKKYAKWAKATAAKPPPRVDPLALEERSGGGGGGGRKSKKGREGSGGGGGGDDEAALVAAIRGQQGNRMAATLASLEARYGGKGEGGRRKGRKGGAAKENEQGTRKKRRRRAEGGSDDVGASGSEDDLGGGEPTEEEFAAARRRLEGKRAAAGVPAAAGAVAGGEGRKGKAADGAGKGAGSGKPKKRK